MSLTASMWSSVTGLLVHGDRMNVIGNNIANINTVGFKGARMDFEDFFYQDIGVANGTGQLGRGASIGIIMNDFSLGSQEATRSATDVAIGGNGFFKVVPKNSHSSFYTRAGNFNFDKDGYLVDPHGYVLQGWKVDNSSRSLAFTEGTSGAAGNTVVGSGVPGDIRIEKLSCDPKHTTHMDFSLNLDSGPGNDKSVDPDNPFFSILKQWDATPNVNGVINPIGSDKVAYSVPIEVFDESGRSHILTVYFDRVTQTSATNIDNLNNDITWEYTVTMNPSDDMRNFSGDPTDLLPDKYKGLLMSGTLTFDSSGSNLKDMTAYVPTSNNMGDLSTWRQAPLSANGFPMLCPNFSGRADASNPWDMSQTPPVLNTNTNGYLIEMNLGVRDQTSTWDPQMPPTAADWSTPITAGGYQNVYKTIKSDGETQYYQKSTNTTPPSTYPSDLSLPGLPSVPAWASLNHTLGAGEVEGTNGLVFEQKRVSQGLRPGEAGFNGYVYVQETGSQTGTGLQGFLFNGSDSKQYIFANGKYYDTSNAADQGRTANQMNAASIALTAVPKDTTDVNNRIGTNTPVNYTVPKFLLDGQGDLIQATVASLHPGMGNAAEKLENATTSYSGQGKNGFVEHNKTQNGYTYGLLRNISINQDGILTGNYSNGVALELFQLTLYDFASKQNLRREGGNLFTETRESGQPSSGAANTGRFGATRSESLEQSNVDLAREFVYMIATQKGFQANSKSITTVDTMLDTVIAMKR